MKKSNAITLATIGILIVAVLLFCLFSTAQSVNTANTTEAPCERAVGRTFGIRFLSFPQ